MKRTKSLTKSLIAIDDRPIRKQAFQGAGAIIKKIDRLESQIESFHAEDQKLFHNWAELTFRDLRKKIEDTHDEYVQLGLFHNRMVAISKKQKLSMVEAYRLLRKEEDCYVNGTEKQREQIRKTREDREKFIEDEIEKEIKRQQEFESRMADFDEDPEDFDGDCDDDDADPIERACLRTLDHVESLSDKKLRKMCRDFHTVFSILTEILMCSPSPRAAMVFLKIWKLTPHKKQIEFNKIFREEFGISLKETLEAMQDMCEVPTPEASSAEAVRASLASDAEYVKLLYRKLVRRLHPDLNGKAQVQLPWHRKIWERVQHAKSDRNELEKLWRLFLIRSKDHRELTVSELYESQRWLCDELNRLNREARGLKRLPAWGFSRRKDYAPVHRKTEKQILKELWTIEEQVAEFKKQHDLMELLAKDEAEERSNRRQRPKRHNSKQMPLF